MPTRDIPWPPGTPCWLDLSADDVEGARDFYVAVFGWSVTDTGAEFGNYQMCQLDGRSVAGIGGKQDRAVPTAWTVYLASDDVDATAKAVRASGGRVLAEPFDVPGAGRMSIAADSQGAVFGLWQAAGHIGAARYNEPGSFLWADVREPDPDDGRRFYAAVFGHTHRPVDGAPADYTTFHLGADPLGGIGGMLDSPHGTVAHWVAYFAVADADRAAEDAEQAGGTVLTPGHDTPFGRMVTIADPQGGRFTVVGPARPEVG